MFNCGFPFNQRRPSPHSYASPNLFSKHPQPGLLTAQLGTPRPTAVLIAHSPPMLYSASTRSSTTRSFLVTTFFFAHSPFSNACSGAEIIPHQRNPKPQPLTSHTPLRHRAPLAARFNSHPGLRLCEIRFLWTHHSIDAHYPAIDARVQARAPNQLLSC